MRLSTVLAATTLAALTLSACGGEPSPRAVTDAMEEIAAASSHDIVAIEIGGWEGSGHVGATVFHRNAERGYTFKDGEVVDSPGSIADEKAMGFPKMPASWDIEAIQAVYPEACENKRIRATQLRHVTAVTVSCDTEVVKAVVGDHELVPIEVWHTEESLATVLGDLEAMASMITSIRWDAGTSPRVVFTTFGENPAGNDCRGFMYRDLDEPDARPGSCFEDRDNPPIEVPIRAGEIDPAKLAAALAAAAEKAGQSVEDARETRVSASSSTMPGTDLGDGPHVTVMWQDGSGADEQATVIVNIGTGDVMWSQIIRDGELVEEPEG